MKREGDKVWSETVTQAKCRTPLVYEQERGHEQGHQMAQWTAVAMPEGVTLEVQVGACHHCHKRQEDQDPWLDIITE